MPVIPQYTKEGYEAAVTQPHLLFQCPDLDYHIVHSTFIYHGISELHVATVNYVLNFLSSTGGSVEEMLAEYLRTIGSWLPMTSRKKLYHSLSYIWSMPRADFALLLLSIYLALQPPFHPCETSATRSQIYSKTKQLFGLLQSAEILSIETVQSALLITVYEYGHGYFQSAFLSVGVCASMVQTLGWHRKRESCDKSAPEEERRVWWAIRVFERYSILFLSLFVINPFYSMPSSTALNEFSKCVLGFSISSSNFPQQQSVLSRPWSYLQKTKTGTCHPIVNAAEVLTHRQLTFKRKVLQC
jgi:hypothetical protein